MPTTHKEFLKERQRYSKIDKRDRKIHGLSKENTPEARKARRAMNDSRTSERTVLGNAWKPDGGYRVAAKCNADRINSNFNSQKGLI